MLPGDVVQRHQRDPRPLIGENSNPLAADAGGAAVSGQSNCHRRPIQSPIRKAICVLRSVVDPDPRH